MAKSNFTSSSWAAERQFAFHSPTSETTPPISKAKPALSAGDDTFPPDAKLVASTDGLELADMAQIERFIAGCARNFPSDRTALSKLSA